MVIGATDPNPRHDGRGRDRLREAGVEVEAGVLDEDCTDLNLIFNHWITTQTPLFAGKAALTLDGKIATRTGHSKWITGPEARLDVMEWRRLFPAIAVGANTVLHDDPRLTSRRDGEDAWCPRRFVFDARLTTIPARGELPGLFCDGHRENTVVVTGEKANEARAKRLTSLGIELWTFPLDGAGVSFRSFRDRCVAEGITGVFFEGGAGIFEGLFKSRQMDYFFTYRAPVIFGDDESLSVFGGETVPKVTDGIRLTSVRHLILGEDTLTRGFVVYSNR